METDFSISIDERKQLIEEASCVVVHSGNILHELLQTSEEICKSFCGVVNRWMEAKSNNVFEKDKLGNGSSLSISSLQDNSQFEETRDELKITVKLFLQGYYPESVEDAVLKVIKDLRCERLDTLLLSLPPTSDSPTQSFRTIKYEAIKDIWLSLQKLVTNGVIGSLGVCDFDLDSLKDLFHSCQVKPVINQINLQHCCFPPEELLSWASTNKVELLTHNDPADILPKKVLPHLLPQDAGKKSWKAVYLMKYSTVVRLREVVRAKGYILCMKALS